MNRLIGRGRPWQGRPPAEAGSAAGLHGRPALLRRGQDESRGVPQALRHGEIPRQVATDGQRAPSDAGEVAGKGKRRINHSSFRNIILRVNGNDSLGGAVLNGGGSIKI